MHSRKTDSTYKVLFEKCEIGLCNQGDNGRSAPRSNRQEMRRKVRTEFRLTKFSNIMFRNFIL